MLRRLAAGVLALMPLCGTALALAPSPSHECTGHVCLCHSDATPSEGRGPCHDAGRSRSATSPLRMRAYCDHSATEVLLLTTTPHVLPHGFALGQLEARPASQRVLDL